MLPLKNLKVLELASVLAGPSVGATLAELGATIIKVENLLTNGDVTRTWKLPTEEQYSDISGYFSCVNWGKKSISIDLTKEEGLGIVYNLAKICDIVLVSYKPGDAEKLKVDYETLNHLNSRIIYAHITGYGLNSSRAGYDAIIQAETGYTFMNGEPGRTPIKMPVALMDILAGHQLKEAIFLALLMLEKTGKGQYIEVSLLKSGIASLANQATNWLVGNSIPNAMGSDHPNIVPYGTIFYTRDEKPIVLAVGNDKQFADLCFILGFAELAKDPRFLTNFDRVNNRDELKAILQKLIGSVDRKPLLEALMKRNVPAGGVYNMKEVFEVKESREMLIESNKNNGKPLKGLRTVAFSFNGNEFTSDLAIPPHYGEHTILILSDLLGYSAEKIQSLTDNQVIYAHNTRK